MIVKQHNTISIPATVKANAKQWAHDHGQRICDKIDWFFQTQGGSR